MRLQALAEMTLTTPEGAFHLSPGQQLTLDDRHALKAVLAAPQHLRILAPAPLAVGVLVSWRAKEGIAGPAPVLEVTEENGARWALVTHQGDSRWIYQDRIIAIDPWPAYEAVLTDAGTYFMAEGEGSLGMQRAAERLSRLLREE